MGRAGADGPGWGGLDGPGCIRWTGLDQMGRAGPGWTRWTWTDAAPMDAAPS
eukprot:gene5228-3990_t